VPRDRGSHGAVWHGQGERRRVSLPVTAGAVGELGVGGGTGRVQVQPLAGHPLLELGADGPDDEFVFGLERILDGVAALIERGR
jgi:hypothetical protein